MKAQELIKEVTFVLRKRQTGLCNGSALEQIKWDADPLPMEVAQAAETIMAYARSHR